MPRRDSPTEAQELLTDIRRHLAWAEEEGETLLGPRPAARARPSFQPPAAVAAAPPAARGAPVQPAARPLPKAVAHPAAASGKAPRKLTELPKVEPFTEADRRPLDEIRRGLGDCKRCRLCEGRKSIVYGVGNPRAELVFVGEGPGAEEDLQGVPFVGADGELLNRMIEAMGMSRDSVYICNVVKCRPPDNRVPALDEIAACEPFLRAQLGAIQPRVLVGLGETAVQVLLREQLPITRVRGTWREFAGIPLMPTFHPAYLLSNPAAKRESWDDLKKVMKILGKEPKRP